MTSLQTLLLPATVKLDSIQTLYDGEDSYNFPFKIANSWYKDDFETQPCGNNSRESTKFHSTVKARLGTFTGAPNTVRLSQTQVLAMTNQRHQETAQSLVISNGRHQDTPS
jgi:hypothetical protein